jgi:hypothetical protein
MLQTEAGGDSSRGLTRAAKSSGVANWLAGPLVLALALGTGCLVVGFSSMVGAARTPRTSTEVQEIRAKTLTCEATAQFETGSAEHPIRGIPLRVVIPNDGHMLSVRYAVRDVASDAAWHDCAEPGSECYPPGNAWFSDFNRGAGPDGQEFGATAWNGSRQAHRIFRVIAVYGTTAGKCTSIMPAIVRAGGNVPITTSTPIGAHLEDVHAEVKIGAPGLEWQPCSWGTDCGRPDGVALSSLMRPTDQGSTPTTYSVVVTNRDTNHDRSVRMVLTYIP